MCCLGWRQLGCCHARSMRPVLASTRQLSRHVLLARHGLLARRGLRWLLRWRAPRCGERRHVCCLGWRQLGRRPARSTRAALASTLARATVWREAARVLPRVAAAEPSPCSLDAGCAGFYAGASPVWRGPSSCLGWRQLAVPCSLDAGCAGFYAGARHGVARGGTCAASGGGSWAVALLARRGLRWLLRWRAPRCGERRHVCCLGWRQLSRRPARSTRAALASTLARATVWREAARVLPRVAAAGPSPCSLNAGCAGFYAGARHGVARGGTCAASGGGS